MTDIEIGKLTNDERAKVFAMYLGQEFLYENGEPDEVQGVYGTIIYGYDADESGEGMFSVDDCKLLLTPLSKITDEHAIEVQKVLHIDENEAGYETNGTAIKNCLVRDGFYAIELFSFYAGVSDVFQYLISKGYAVPLWFGIDHPCNGKTAIELKIAIEKTNS